jgi:hypothetical protein
MGELIVYGAIYALIFFAAVSVGLFRFIGQWLPLFPTKNCPACGARDDLSDLVGWLKPIFNRYSPPPQPALLRDIGGAKSALISVLLVIALLLPFIVPLFVPISGSAMVPVALFVGIYLMKYVSSHGIFKCNICGWAPGRDPASSAAQTASSSSPAMTRTTSYKERASRREEAASRDARAAKRKRAGNRPKSRP